MKKIVVTLMACILLSAAVTTQVYAEDTQTPIAISETGQIMEEPVLKDVQTIIDEETRQIIKSYEVPVDFEIGALGEKGFEKNGYYYERGDILLISENTERHTKLVSQTVTVSHKEKESGALFMPLLDYSTDGYIGQLKLDTASIFTEPTGKEAYSYTVTDTREFKALARNDTYYIPKTAEKNSVSLSLKDVVWTPMGDGTYNAAATYSGNASGTKITGYTSTAVYIGEVAKTETISRTYKVIYDGKIIPPLAPSMLPWIFSGVGLIVLLIAGAFLFRYRKNTKIYAVINGRYEVVKRIRLNYLNPAVDLTANEVKVQSEEYIIVIDRFAVREMHGQFIQILTENGNVIHRKIVNEGHDIKLQISAVPENKEGTEL